VPNAISGPVTETVEFICIVCKSHQPFRGHNDSGGADYLNIGDLADVDDIVVDNDGHQSGRADWVNGGEVHVRDDQEGGGSQIGNGLMDWEEQYPKDELR
jgi:hypothetical protein